MRRKSRFWGVAYYAGLAGCVLALAAFLVSMGWDVWWCPRTGCGAVLSEGRLQIPVTYPNVFDFIDPPRGVFLGAERWRYLTFRSLFQIPSLTDKWLSIPLWLILLALMVVTGWAARQRGGAHAPHRCGGCGYDLTGNVSGRCPECGGAVGPARK